MGCDQSLQAMHDRPFDRNPLHNFHVSCKGVRSQVPSRKKGGSAPSGRPAGCGDMVCCQSLQAMHDRPFVQNFTMDTTRPSLPI